MWKSKGEGVGGKNIRARERSRLFNAGTNEYGDWMQRASNASEFPEGKRLITGGPSRQCWGWRCVVDGLAERRSELFLDPLVRLQLQVQRSGWCAP